MMKTFKLHTVVSLISTAFIATSGFASAPNDTAELDQPGAFARPSEVRARERLPKTLVMRVSENGQVAVAHLDKVLDATKDPTQIAHAKFSEVTAEKLYRQTDFNELDIDESSGREAWYYVYRPYIPYGNRFLNYYSVYPYHPTYYYGGYQYNYVAYYAFNFGGFYYYYYGW